MTNKGAKLGVVGVGPWMEMVVKLARDAGTNVVVWPGHWEGRRPKGTGLKAVEKAVGGPDVVVTNDPAVLGAETWLIIMATPTWRLRGSSRLLGDHVGGYHRLVQLVRGLEPETGLRASELLAELTPVKRLAALSGPLFPEVVLAGDLGGAVVGSKFPGVIDEVQRALASARFRVYGNTDLVGVEIASVAAPLISLVAGLASGANLGPSVQGTLVARGVAEIGRLSKLFGGLENTAVGMSGLGYVVAQSTYTSGADFQAGVEIARGSAIKDVEAKLGLHIRELVVSSRVLAERARTAKVKAHIITATSAILNEGGSVQDAIRQLMTLSQMME